MQDGKAQLVRRDMSQEEYFYLPSHLIQPFFQDKPIRFRIGQGEEQTGVLDITVSLDRSCRVQIMRVRNFRTAACSAAQILTSEMLDKVRWDASKGEFFAIFD